MPRGRAVSRLLLAIGVLLILAGLLLPLIKLPQTFEASGPRTPFSQTTTYWVDWYRVPPISAGEKLMVELTTMEAQRAQLAVFPLRGEGEELAGLAVIIAALGGNETHFQKEIVAPVTARYLFMVVSFNSTFTLTVKSTWSPFYDARTSAILGVFLAGLAIVSIYYYRLKGENLGPSKQIESKQQDQ